MNNTFSETDAVNEAASYIESLDFKMPQVACVAGSGLGILADSMTNVQNVPFEDVPNMPRPTVAGHAGNLIVGEWATDDASDSTEPARLALLSGRKHMYEGCPPQDTTFAMRLMARLGVKAVILTNAAGGLRSDYKVGDLMLVRNTINMVARMPFLKPREQPAGTPISKMGMAEPFCNILADAVREEAARLHIDLREGVYVSMRGPGYETRAEIRMLRMAGADAVGMSTVPETMAALREGMRVVAISLITNPASEVPKAPLDHQEVLEAADAAKDKLGSLLHAIACRVASMDIELKPQ